MSYLRAKFRFEAENDDEISFEKGDYLIVEKVVDGDWLSGRIVRKDGGESKSGLFPKNYCKEIDKLPWVTKAAPAKVEVKAKAAFAFGMYLSLNFLRARLRRRRRSNIFSLSNVLTLTQMRNKRMSSPSKSEILLSSQIRVQMILSGGQDELLEVGRRDCFRLPTSS